MTRTGREPKRDRNHSAEQKLRQASDAHAQTAAELHTAFKAAIHAGVPIARAARLASIARGTAYRWIDQD